jgi:hypothetical protein
LAGLDRGFQPTGEDQLRRLREKLSQNASAEEIRRAMDELAKNSQELGEEAYRRAAEGGASPNASKDSTPGDGGYVDAEYDSK